VDELLARRSEDGPYSSLTDFLTRIDSRIVNHKVLEALIQAGIFDSLHDNRATLLHNLDRIIEIVARKKEEARYGQTSLFGSEEKSGLQDIEMETIPDWSDLDRLSYEKEILGFYFSGHPLDRYREIWKNGTTLDLANIERGITDKVYTLLGMVHGVKEIQTRKGQLMSFAVFEDYSGSVELVFFPDTWEKFKFMVEAAPILGIKGKLDRKRDEPKILVEEVVRPEEIEPSQPSEIHIRFDSKKELEEDLLNLRSLLMEHRGKCGVFVHLMNNGDAGEVIIKASSQISVSPSETFLDKLKEIPRIQEVWRV
jgi:DNA polymerase-3 subunit alpha